MLHLNGYDLVRGDGMCFNGKCETKKRRNMLRLTGNDVVEVIGEDFLGNSERNRDAACCVSHPTRGGATNV
jgi:hypothetical protein